MAGGAGCAPGYEWCRCHRRGRWSPAAGRAYRAAERTPRSRPRTAAETARRRVPPGSGVGTIARRIRLAQSPLTRHSRRLTATGPAPWPCPPGRGGVDHRPVALLQLADPAPGELPDQLVPAGFGEETQRSDGQVVIRLLESVATSVGDHEDLGRPSPAAVPVDPCLPALDHAVGLQRVQVPADGCRCQPEPGAQRSGGRRSVLQDRPRHAGAGASMGIVLRLARWPLSSSVSHGFHNTIVLYFCSELKPTHARTQAADQP